MSRTRKDRPYWVRSMDPTEDRSEYHNHDNGVCDIDTTPGLPWREQSLEDCSYELPWSHATPPHAYVHARWWGPQRTSERAACRKLVQQYNGSGDVNDNDVPAPEQTRSSAKWWWS